MTAGIALPPDALRRRETVGLWAYVCGNTLSNIGSFMQGVAVPFILFTLTGSNAWVGAGVFAALVSSVVTSPIGGIVIERWPQRRVLAVSQVVQMVASLALLALSLADSLTPWAILGLSVVGGLGAGIQFPVGQALIPSMVSPDRVAAGLRYATFGQTIARTAGPALGAVVLGLLGANALFLANALSFLVFLTALLFVHPRPAPPGDPGRSVLTRYRDTIRYVRSRPNLRMVLFLAFVVPVFGTSIAFLVPGVVARYGAGGTGVGAMMAIFGAGAITGSLTLMTLGDRLTRGRATRVALVLLGSGTILAVTTSRFGIGACAFVVVGIGYTLWLNSVATAFQLGVDDEHRGRATAVYMVIVVVGTPIGSMLNGWLGDVFGLPWALGTSGVIILALAAFGNRWVHYHQLDTVEVAEDGHPV